MRAAGIAGFGALIGYVRATFLVALVDAAGIGTGLAIMGVPLALPLASLVFLGAFIPLVGAVVSGFLAVVVALLAKGLVYALIALGLIIAREPARGHILQPLVMGRAVSIHPLAVVVAISTGGVLGGIVGALLAVPTVAFFNSAFQVLLAKDPPLRQRKTEDRGVRSRPSRTADPSPGLSRSALQSAFAAQQILRAEPPARRGGSLRSSFPGRSVSRWRRRRSSRPAGRRDRSGRHVLGGRAVARWVVASVSESPGSGRRTAWRRRLRAGAAWLAGSAPAQFAEPGLDLAVFPRGGRGGRLGVPGAG